MLAAFLKVFSEQRITNSDPKCFHTCISGIGENSNLLLNISRK